MRVLVPCIALLAAPVIAGVVIVLGLTLGLADARTFLVAALAGGLLSDPFARRLAWAVVLRDPGWDAARDRPLRSFPARRDAPRRP